MEEHRHSDDDSIARIEAALYVSGRPLAPHELAKAAGITSERRAITMARELAKVVKSNFKAVEIAELEGQRFVLQLNHRYAHIARRFASRPLVSTAVLRTLSYIAYFQPISSLELARKRGTRVYRHLKELQSLGFVSGEVYGRTKLYRTTRVFAEYFGISPDVEKMKEQLKAIKLPRKT